MRSSSAFGTLHFGERLTFITSASGEVTGYDMASSARFVRELAFVPLAIEQLRAPPEAPYTGVERRKELQALYTGIERRKQLEEHYAGLDRRKDPQAPYSGVERRAGGSERRGQRRAVH
jgi:hypothetical protein